MEEKNILSTSELKKVIDETPFYTFFKERLYVYNEKTHVIWGYMLKEDFNPKKLFKKNDDEEAAAAFAQIEMLFKSDEEESAFDYESFVDTVLSEIEVWLSYSTELREEVL